jgi:glycosyltransferase involved in cell wall biosynthesis
MKPTSPRLALFLESLAGGGAERVITTLLTAWAAEAERIDLVLARASGPLLGDLPAGLRVVDLGAPRMAIALPRLIGYLRRTRPATLMCSGNPANLVALTAAMLAGGHLPIVVRQSEIVSTVIRDRVRDRLIPPAMRLLYPRAARIVAISEGVAGDLISTLGLAPARITVIHNPIALHRVRELAAATAPHPWLDGDAIPVVLAAGRLTTQKDFPTLLAAFAQLRRGRDMRLIVLGEGPLRTALRAQADRLGIGEDVDFPGYAANPYAYMARARLFVLSSLWEGFGNVLVEALACQCPVVSTDCPSGPREILADGRYGQLVPPGDADALAGAMGEALAAEPDRPALLARAAHFDAPAIARRYWGILDRGMSGKRME